MPDSKITALTSIGTSTDPANDPLVIVDVSDTSMAATGTTKKVTLNQLLATSPTATLASTTITGDLTVDTNTLKVDSTNNDVIVGATSAIGSGRFSVQADLSAKQGICVKNSAASYGASNNLIRFTNSSDLTIGGITHPAATSLGIWGVTEIQFFLGGVATTAMTLNSTGLGVGTSPSYKVHSVVTSGYAGAFKSSTGVAGGILCGNTVGDLIVGVDASGNGRVTADTSKYLGLGSNGINDRATLDSAGNFVVGIAAVATTATDGFLYVTGCAGTPTGTPTAKTGRVPIVVDTTNNKLYFYSGGSWVAAN
jgi:hypothetical protein